jgi:hypothetical protein
MNPTVGFIRSPNTRFRDMLTLHGVFKANRTGTGTKACLATRCVLTWLKVFLVTTKRFTLHRAKLWF